VCGKLKENLGEQGGQKQYKSMKKKKKAQSPTPDCRCPLPKPTKKERHQKNSRKTRACSRKEGGEEKDFLIHLKGSSSSKEEKSELVDTADWGGGEDLIN